MFGKFSATRKTSCSLLCLGKVHGRIVDYQTQGLLYCEGSLTAEILPELLVDVMDLVVQLAERYLWTDTACITQDDIYDKQRQLPVMDSIYSNAALTIIATAPGTDIHLPRWRATETECASQVCSPTENLVEILNGIPFTISWPDLSGARCQTVSNSRGWKFQEGMLARRALILQTSKSAGTVPRILGAKPS